MTQYYEIKSGLDEVIPGQLVSSFEVLTPAGEGITHYDTDNTVAQKTTLRYFKFSDNSLQDKEKGSHIISWNNQQHTVVIEINSDMAAPGGDISRKTDIAD